MLERKRRLWEEFRSVKRWAGLTCVVGTLSPSSLGSWRTSGAGRWERQVSNSQLAGCNWEKCSVLLRLPKTSSGQSAQCQNGCAGRNKKPCQKKPGEGKAELLLGLLKKIWGVWVRLHWCQWFRPMGILWVSGISLIFFYV